MPAVRQAPGLDSLRPGGTQAVRLFADRLQLSVVAVPWTQLQSARRPTRFYCTVRQPPVTSRMKSRTVLLMNSRSSVLKPGDAATWPCTEGIAT